MPTVTVRRGGAAREAWIFNGATSVDVVWTGSAKISEPLNLGPGFFALLWAASGQIGAQFSFRVEGDSVTAQPVDGVISHSGFTTGRRLFRVRQDVNGNG